MKNIYLIINSYGYGGAEKRFFEIWLELKKSIPLHIIISKKTLDDFIDKYQLNKSIYEDPKIIVFQWILSCETYHLKINNVY